MSEEKKEEIGFWRRLGIKTKLILGVIASAISFLAIVLIRSKINARTKVNYELDKVRRETEMAGLEESFEKREQKLAVLRQKEKDLRAKLKDIEEREYKGEEVSVDEIDEFFRKRGLM